MINLTQGLPALRSTDLGLEGKIALIMKFKYSLRNKYLEPIIKLVMVGS